VGEIIYNMISPFLIQKGLHWSPIGYGYLSIFIVLGLLTGTLIAKYFVQNISHGTMVLGGLIITLLASISMLIPSILEVMNIFTIIIPMFIFMIGVGIIYPNTNMGALSPFTAMAGIAGALQGGLQMVGASFLGIILAHVHLKGQLLLSTSLSVLSFAGLIGFIFLIKESSK
jgi:DHA1 family bicyclomycin/chloramphenicol resistance-like MFS transporter